MMSAIERENDENDAEGHGDLLDDFVSSALVPVGFCNHAPGLWATHVFVRFVIPLTAHLHAPHFLQVSTRRTALQKLATVPESEGEEMSSEGVYDDSASSLSDDSHADLHGDALVSHGNRRGSSIASTYWRPERTDRTEISSVLDERCCLLDPSLPT